MSAHSTAHLTQEELTDKLLGVSSLTVNAHLLGCPACAQELERLKSSVADFRVAAHSWSEDALAASGSARSSSTRLAAWPARWILATAALVLFVAGSLTYLQQERTASQAHSAQVSKATASAGLSQAQLDQDNELLSQVNGELSEAVPAPMQPLLVSESVGSGATTKKQIAK